MSRAMSRATQRGWWRLITPRDNTSAPFTAEQLYAAIHAGTGRGQRTQLLLAGTHLRVGLWVGAETERLDPLAALLRATYPDLELDDQPPPLDPHRGPDADAEQQMQRGAVIGARWSLLADPAYPIKTVRAFEHSDPVAIILGALATARPDETGLLSVVLTPGPGNFPRRSLALARALTTGGATGPWWQRALLAGADAIANTASAVVSSAVGSATDQPAAIGGRERPAGAPGGPVLHDADLEARLKWITVKAAQPVFRATITTAYSAETPARAQQGHAALAAALGQFTVVGQNALHPRATTGTTAWAGPAGGLPRRREKTVLAIDELAGLVHVPGPDTVVAHLPRAGARHRAATAPMDPGGLPLARSLHRHPAAGSADPDAADQRGNDETAAPVGVSVTDLMSHAYVIGPSGTGKTTLLTHLCLSLAETGCGQIVLDPHGDLAHQLLARLPDEQLHRVVLFDLADPTNLPTLNPLHLDPTITDPGQIAVARSVRAAAVRAVFADLWGLHRATTPNLLHFLDAALAALIAAQPTTGTGTLADLPRLLTDAPWRAHIVRAGGDRRVAARWAEFAALGRDDQSRTVRAILNKAADFDRNPILATVFGDPGPGLQIADHMDAGDILVVSLPRGLVPEGTVELIGSVLVSLAYQAALAREDRPPERRPPVVAVIDEFQEFALTTFAKALTATRKYGLGLVVANQNLSRINALSPDLLETLLANVATLIAFRTAPDDAETLAPYLPPYEPADLTALAPGHSYWRTPGPAGPHTTAAATPPPKPPLRDGEAVTALAARLRPPGRPLDHDGRQADADGPKAGGQPWR
jgi:hypothetical protein